MAKRTGLRLSATATADLLGITPRWLQKLVEGEWIPRSARGEYDAQAAVQGYVRSIKAEKGEQSKGAGEERIRLARAERLERENREADRELIPLEEAFAGLDEIAAMLKADVNSIPARMTRDVTLRAELQRHVDDALRQAADRLKRILRELETGEEEPDPLDIEDPVPALTKAPRRRTS